LKASMAAAWEIERAQRMASGLRRSLDMRAPALVRIPDLASLRTSAMT
jgi:hypothetical protein